MTICTCHCCLTFLNVLCCSISVLSISDDSTYHFEKYNMADSTPASKWWRAIDNTDSTNNDFDSNVPISSLLCSRKTALQPVKSKKKNPVVLTQGSIKSAFKLLK